MYIFKKKDCFYFLYRQELNMGSINVKQTLCCPGRDKISL
jgi:hypothetical protein